jgi:cytidylate kinase
MIIAVDGPAGSGKSTVAKTVAERLGFHYLDTGAMYRAVTFRALASGIPFTSESRVAEIARDSEITFVHEPGSAQASRVLIDGDDVTAAIRTPRVDEAVSTVARMASVREALVEQQRRIAATEDIVMEGRDIGTVVFPDAEVKVFLTATPEERSKRRAAQQAASGVLVDPAGVREAIIRRDEADSTREVAPLAPAADARVIDTTGLEIEDVVVRIVAIVEVGRE